VVFIILLVVLIIAYGVTSSALLYPNEWRTGDVTINSVFRAYFTLYGEMFDEETSYANTIMSMKHYYTKIDQNEQEYSFATHINQQYNEQNCYSVFAVPNDQNSDTTVFSPSDYKSIVRCPQGHGWVYIFLFVYMLLTNVMLLNLLIALFTTTYSRTIEQSDQIWKFQKTAIVKEFRDRPRLPPPFILLSYVYEICRKVWIGVKICLNKVESENLTKSAIHLQRYRSEIIFNVNNLQKRRLGRLERVSAEDMFASEFDPDNDEKTALLRKIDKLEKKLDEHLNNSF